MWFKEYRDYPTDRPLIKEKVEPEQSLKCTISTAGALIKTTAWKS